MVTRLQSGIVKPIDRLSLHTTSISPLPKSPFLALQNPHWNNAMHDEYNALVKNGTWILVPRPAGINLVRFMWLFKYKFHDDGTLSHYKARLVSNGSSQQLGLFLSQKHYTIELLARAHMTNCNPSRTPVDTDSKLGPEGSSSGPHFISQSCSVYYATFEELWILDFTCTQRQQTISCFSAETEYQGVANVVAETAWLRNLLRELHSPLSAATLVYCDNVSATYLSANPVQHQRTKHIEIDIHFVRDLVTAGQVRVLHVPSRYQYADIFTKGLPSALFEDFRSSLSVRLPPARTAWAY
nr:ribonuclease H-like domain-containing protein [Tanacetum cinerariifolium]